MSPFINDPKTERIDSFINYFKKMQNFNVIAKKDNRNKYEWISDKEWTRVVRIFKVTL